MNDLLSFKRNVMMLGLCTGYKNKWDVATSKEALMDIALDSVWIFSIWNERFLTILMANGSGAEIVHSLAKWKRHALGRYGFAHGEGLYTDMNAIRRDEETDNVHSLFVDQWDWERIIDKEERNVDTLKRGLEL